MADQVERVYQAACRSPDGEVFTGIHHGIAYRRAVQEGRPNVEDGFMTTLGRFVTREEALDLHRGLPPGTSRDNGLTSDDVTPL